MRRQDFRLKWQLQIRQNYRGKLSTIRFLKRDSRGKWKQKGKNISFYKFTEDVKRKELRLKQITRNVQVRLLLWFPTITQVETPKFKVLESSFVANKWSRVCSDHFTDGKIALHSFLWPKTQKIARNHTRDKEFRWVPYFVMCTICVIYLMFDTNPRVHTWNLSNGHNQNRYIIKIPED